MALEWFSLPARTFHTGCASVDGKCCSAERRGNKEAPSLLQTHPLRLSSCGRVVTAITRGPIGARLCNQSSTLFSPLRQLFLFWRGGGVNEGEREGEGGGATQQTHPPPRPPGCLSQKKNGSGGSGHKESSMLC